MEKPKSLEQRLKEAREEGEAEGQKLRRIYEVQQQQEQQRQKGKGK